MQLRRQGQIVVISSLASLQPVPHIWLYSASKTALSYLVEGLYRDLKPQGIQVTSICPGFIKTEMTAEQGLPEAWTMELQPAVDRIMKAIDQRKRSVYFPWWMFAGLKMISFLPDRLRLAALDRIAIYLRGSADTGPE